MGFSTYQAILPLPLGTLQSNVRSQRLRAWSTRLRLLPRSRCHPKAVACFSDSLASYRKCLSEPALVAVLYSRVLADSATPWTVIHQAPLPVGCPKQESWSGSPFPSPGGSPRPWSPALQVDSLAPEPPGKFKASSNSLELVTELRRTFGILDYPSGRWYNSGTA